MLYTDTLPKHIWFLWLQGIDNAPLVVKRCYESYINHNPSWEVILLDENNLKNYIAPEFIGQYHHLTSQALSDLIRINLLAQYGGVWVDATCFCMMPLDSWLDKHIGSGFFAFERPGADRMISSWFIAAAKNNYIANTYQLAVNAYWKNNPLMVFFEESRWYFMAGYLQKLGTHIWFSKLVTRGLKVYPYFWFHYLFENIYNQDEQFKKMWDDGGPKISADLPHALQFAGLFNPLNDQIKDQIDNHPPPCYKLTWKTSADIANGTISHYLLNRNND